MYVQTIRNNHAPRSTRGNVTTKHLSSQGATQDPIGLPLGRTRGRKGPPFMTE